jgi:hypothetical protein
MKESPVLFRKARSEDIDILHRLLVAEAAQGRFDPRLAEEPYSAGLRKNLNNIRKRGRRLDEDLEAQLLVWGVPSTTLCWPQYIHAPTCLPAAHHRRKSPVKCFYAAVSCRWTLPNAVYVY